MVESRALIVNFSLHGHQVVFELPDTTDLIQKKISDKQTFYELDLLEQMRARARRGELAVDVGAHLGNHTIFLAKICGMRVMAFEPQPDMYRALVRNVELNGLQDQVQTFNMALGEVEGTGTMARRLADNTGSAALSLGTGDVRISTLDERVGEARVALLKIDVEGFEIEVLKGGARTIERDEPLIFAEAAEDLDRQTLATHLAPYGYVAGAQFGGTPVVLFEHCKDEQQRFQTLVGRIESAQEELGKKLHRRMREDARELRQKLTSLSSGSTSLDRRLATAETRLHEILEKRLPELDEALGRLESCSVRQSALLYEVWGLGQQIQHLAGGDARYRPLGAEASQLADWVPKRKTWTVPKGMEADAFLQGYSAKTSVHPGDYIAFHASTTEVPQFVKLRLFGFSERGQLGPTELATSQPLAVPASGVWSPRAVGEVDPASWPEVARMRIGRSWRPGCYVARFETLDGHAVLHPFWVTSNNPQSRVVRLSSVMTHLSRNSWGIRGGKLGRLFRQHGSTALHRPYEGSRGGRVLRNELPLFRWAEANAVRMDCLTDLEVHQQPSLLDAYDHVVIAGDCSFLSAPVLEALERLKGEGKSISVFAAAPAQYEVEVDLDGETLRRRAQSPVRSREWQRMGEGLWGAWHRWSRKGKALGLEVLPQAGNSLLAGSSFETPLKVDGVVDGRLSGTDLEDSDPRLVARARDGGHSCDATVETTAQGGRIFVAGSDLWATAIDDLFSSKSLRFSPALDYATAQLVGVAADPSKREPLVSVVMTAYDSESYIASAIDSILAQNYSNLELIVVDDNSSDGTFELLLEYAARDPRVRPFKSLVNHGTYWSKNFGMTKARGELITFQDSDDTSDPDRLLLQVQAMRWNPGAIASMVDYERRNEAGELVLNRGAKQRRCFPSLMVRADTVLPKIGFFDSVRTSADQEYLHRLRVVFGSDTVVELRQPLYFALVREGSLTTSGGGEVNLGPNADDSADGHLSEGRRRYVQSFQDWHRGIVSRSADPYMPFPLSVRPFAVAPELGIDSGRRQEAPVRGALLRSAMGEDAAVGTEIGELWELVDGARPDAEPSRDVDVRLLATGTNDFKFTVEPMPGIEGERAAGLATECIVGIERPEDAAANARARGGKLDVVLMSDFRFSGGTTQSNAAEIVAQHRQGLKTGLIQAASPVLKRNHPINPRIQGLVDEGAAHFIADGQVPRCKLLVIRHPTVLERPASELPRVQADRVVVIVNQAPADEHTGRVFYDMAACQARAKQIYGSEGTWYPIGPLVRKAVAGLPGAEHLAESDWHNIIDTEEWRTERHGFVGERPTIGRHSRDSADKWPGDPATLLAAYPDDPAFSVRILGGAESARKVLGRIPTNWEVLDFGSMAPRDFLASVDFFVYFHHPSLVEAFGRTILEALATGTPAILPEHFRDLFEDVPIYSKPEDVRRVVGELYADRERYQAIARKGVAFVEERFSYGAHLRRLRELMPADDAMVPALADEGGPRPAGEPVEAAYLDPDGIYKFDIELGNLSSSSRGAVRGWSQNRAELVFDEPVDGSKSVISKFVVNDGRRDRVEVLVEVAEGSPPFSVIKMKARRRAERAKQPTLELTDDSITAAFATYPGRRKILPDVIDSLAPQVDRLFVYLNNYDHVPSCITEHPLRERIVYILDPASQRRAAAKFHWLEIVRGFHLVCDDDILYPANYAAEMVAAIERHGRKAIVGVHGVIFESELKDARSSRRKVFKFPEALGEDTPVHFLGTGTVALHTSVLPAMDLSKFMAYPIANDEILAVSAKTADVPMICVRREAGWLQPHPEVRFGIFEERQIDGGEHDKATELLVGANPWPELPVPS